MGRSRSRSPRYRSDRDRDRRRRSRSPRSRRSRSPRRRRRSRSPAQVKGRGPPERNGRNGGYDDKHRGKDADWKNPQDAQFSLTLGGSLGVQKPKQKKKKVPAQPTIVPTQPEDMTDEDKRMQEIMGFGNFDTTKGKKVQQNDVYAINRKVERKYRQYMNRKGGFNRPLDFMP
ncbi:uncharacterized protein LOC143464885 [Clavelina lepadiformis]|uniref:U4/U6.U5 small nuclear ribonucleoprotein 27 kDa protein n=1 Tax=Clavelina lepadiformis TaxID=159417 RepID=A0ABP0EXS4_CLALP